MNLTKVELLWTYKCSLNCKGCAMNSGEKNSRTVNEWKIGIDNFIRHGASFMAVYGAEPLEDFDKLPEVINYAETNALNVSLITSYSDYQEKLKTLYENNLKSLTTSYYLDKAFDKSTQIKNDQALKMLNYFQSLDTGCNNIRNVAVIVTVTRNNIKDLVEFVKNMTYRGIWVFLDFLHFKRHSFGTKCSGKYNPKLHTITPFAADRSGWERVSDIMFELADLASLGFLVNMSYPVAEEIKRQKAVADWKCEKSSVFPSWITVDPFGNIHPCDDFRCGNEYDIINFPDDLERLKESWKTKIDRLCKGCLWTTHIQSHAIKHGFLSDNSFIKDE